MKNKLSLILAILIIINIILLTYLIQLKPVKEIDVRKDDEEQISENLYEDLDIVVYNLYDLIKIYNGEIDISRFCDKLYNVLNIEFPKIYNETKKVGVNQYFNKNSKYVEETLGISKYDDFKKIVELLNVYNNSKYTKVTIAKDSCKTEEKITKCKLEIEYSNNQKIYLQVILNNQIIGNKDIVILADKGGK